MFAGFKVKILFGWFDASSCNPVRLDKMPSLMEQTSHICDMSFRVMTSLSSSVSSRIKCRIDVC